MKTRIGLLLFHITCLFMSRNVLRWSVERFWYPFMAAKTGPNISLYRFRENIDSMRTPDADFTCQVNGEVGGVGLLENFFSVLLCGFDISDVFFRWKTSTCDPNETHYSGHYILSHSRPFLGWYPPVHSSKKGNPPVEAISSSPVNMGSSSAPSCGVDFSSSRTPPDSGLHYASRRGKSMQRCTEFPRLEVPFFMHVEGGGSQDLLSHIVFSSPAFSRLSRMHGCPSTVQECLSHSKALKLITALRRAQVEPELITAEAVLKAAKSSDNWVDALKFK